MKFWSMTTAVSTLTVTRSPGVTVSKPADRARIFSTIVMPMGAFLQLIARRRIHGFLDFRRACNHTQC
jgi:hypothetical protein